MAEAKIFRLTWRVEAAVQDSLLDLDEDPELRGIYSGLTITPSAKGFPVIKAPTMTPARTIPLAPYDARIDGGVLMLRTGQEQPGVRMYGKSSALGLGDVPLIYELKPYGTTFNGKSQQLPTIRIVAPTIPDDHDDEIDGEIVLDVTDLEWLETSTVSSGGFLIRQVPDGYRLDGTTLVFTAGGVDISDGVELPEAGAASWGTLSDKPAVIAGGATAEEARTVLEFKPQVNLITAAVNVLREGAVGNGATNDRVALQGLIDTYAGSRELRFPSAVYRLGNGEGSGSNRLTLPSDTKLIFDPGAEIQVNARDWNSGISIIYASGTDGAKVNTTADYAAGIQVLTLPTGAGAGFAVGDIIGFECGLPVTAELPGLITGTGRARELHKVEWISGDEIYLDRPLEWAYTTTNGAQFWKMTPVKGLLLDGLKFTSGPSIAPGTDTSYMVRLNRTVGAVVAGMEMHNTIGGVYLFDALDAHVDGLLGDRLPRQSTFAGYVLAAGGSTLNLIVDGLRGREFRHLFTTLADERAVTGTAQAGGASTITLAAGAAAVDNAYDPASIVISSGTGAGQSKEIVAYNGTTKVAAVDSAWSVQPDATSVYSISTFWGGPQHVTVNGAVGQGGRAGTAVFDTHEFGRHIKFNGCVAHGGYQTGSIIQAGFQIRAQHVELVGCSANRMGRQGVNIQQTAEHVKITGGEFGENTLQGISVKGKHTKIVGPTVRANLQEGIYVDSVAEDTTIMAASVIDNVGQGIQDGTGSLRTKIMGCEIPASANQVDSIWGLSPTSIAKDCVVTGYGNFDHGMASMQAGARWEGLVADASVLSNVPIADTSLVLIDPDDATKTATFVVSGTGARTYTLPNSSDTLLTASSTATQTNKRITKRLVTQASAATPTCNTDTADVFMLTALATDITDLSTNFTGTPTPFQPLLVVIVATATRNITYGSKFESGPVALPSATNGTQRLELFFMWNSTTSKWRLMSVGSAA